MNREAWLTAAADALWPRITKAGGKKPKHWKVACGWPSSGALPRLNGRRTLGQCWVEGSKDGIQEMFITPSLEDPVRVLDVLAHELIHAALPAEVMHKARFARMAKAIGLTGKPTATEAGPELAEELKELAEKLGPYPHAAIDGTVKRKKQTTRLLLVICPECGCKLRITSYWLDMWGPPTCGCGTTMVTPEELDEDEPLQIAESSILYRTKDQRFEIRYERRRRGESWYLIDTTEDRLSIVETRVDATDLITAIREGLYAYPPRPGWTRTEYGDIPPLWTPEDTHELPDFDDVAVLEEEW